MTPGAKAPPAVTAFAPGKLLLFGEHAVVYGAPAVGIPLSRGVHAELRPGRGRVTAELAAGLELPDSSGGAGPEDLVQRALGPLAATTDVHLRLEVPPMCGYGSSAAVAVALLKAKSELQGTEVPGPRVLWREALEVEQAAHAKPSGVDPAVVVWGEPIVFRRFGEEAEIQPQRFARPVYLVAGWCGAHGGTRVSVTGLATLRAERPRLVQAAMDTLAEASKTGSKALAEGDHRALGPALDLAHGVLSGFGLVGASVEAAVRAARRAGALGAKMSGAGGAGGAWLAMFDSENSAVSGLQALRAAGHEALIEKLGA